MLAAPGEGSKTRVLVRLRELTAWRESLDPLMRAIELVLWPDAPGIRRPFSLENRGWPDDVFVESAEIPIVYGAFR